MFLVTVNAQQNFESRIKLSNRRTTFIPKNSLEYPLKNVSVSSILRCGKQCNENIFCRIFIYDDITLNCQLYLTMEAFVLINEFIDLIRVK